MIDSQTMLLWQDGARFVVRAGHSLPVRVFCVWARRELDLGVCAVKEDVEPGEERVHVCPATSAASLADRSRIYAQSFRVAVSVNGCVNVRSSFLTVLRSMCCGRATRCQRAGTEQRAHGTDLNQTWVGDDRLELDSVDERFAKGDFLDARVIEPVHVVPDCADRDENSAHKIVHRTSAGAEQRHAQLIFSSLYSESSIAAR